MRRVLSRRLLVGITVLVCGSACFANTVNLLKNSEFLEEEPDKPGTFKHWEISGGNWMKKERLGKSSFWNKDSMVPYIERDGADSAYITQTDIPVKPDTWYLLIAWYKANPLANRASGNVQLTLHAFTAGEKKARLGPWFTLGPTKEWVRLRSFFYSGTNSSVSFKAGFFGKGIFSFGSCEVREFKPSDMHASGLVDGGFEKGILGNQPTEFYTGKDILTVSEAGSQDGLCMKVNVPKDENIDLRTRGYRVRCLRRIPANTGDTVSLSFMARASVPGFELATAIYDEDGWVHSEYRVLSSEWKRIAIRTTVFDRGEKAPQGIQLLGFNIQGGGPADTVWIDDVSFSVESPQSESGSGRPGKHKVMNSSFEAGSVGWTWTFAKDIRQDTPTGSVIVDNSTATEGSNSLRIDIPNGKDAKRQTRFLLSNVFFPAQAGDTFTISFWAKADNSATISVGLTPRYATFGGNVTINDKWRRYHLQVPLTGNYASRLKGHVALVMSFSRPGAYWVDAVQVERGPTMTAYAPTGDLEVGAVCDRMLYPCYVTGESPKATVYLCSRLERASSLTLRYDTVDWLGNTVDSREETVTVPAGKTITHDINLFSRLTGAFVTRLSLSDSVTGTSSSTPLVYGIFPRVRNIPPDQSWFGFQSNLISHQGAYRLKGGTLDDLFHVMRMTGAQWFCLGSFVNWASIEPEQNKWQWMDRFVDTCLRNGVSILPILGTRMTRTPKWAYSDKLVDGKYADTCKQRGIYYPKMELWETYVRTVVEHYAGKIDVYEYLSETGDCSSSAFLEYGKAVHKVIKEFDPTIRVVGPSYPCQRIPYGSEDNSWIGQVLKAGIYDFIDVYSGHWYPTMGDHYGLRYGVKQPVETASTTWGMWPDSHFKQMEYLKTAYGRKPVWDTESAQGGAPQVKWMFNPYHIPVSSYCSAKTQADRNVRWSVIKMASGITRMFYHQFCGDHPLSSSFHVRMFECNNAPKPAIISYAQMARRLDGFTFLRRTTLAGSTMMFLFQVDGKPVAVYWNYAAEKPQTLTLPLPAGAITVEDLMGNEIKPDARKNSVTLPLGKSPVYIIGKTIHAETLFRAFEKARITGGKVGDLGVAFGHKDSEPAILIGLRSASTSPLNGTAEITEMPREWTAVKREGIFTDVPPNTDQFLAIPLRHGEALSKEGHLAVKASVSGENLEAKRSVLTANVPAKKGEVIIDGRITDNEYGETTLISLGKDDQLRYTSSKAIPPSASADVRIVWDEQAIYIGMEVKDDRVILSNNNNALYAGDCVEIYVDTDTALGMFENAYITHEGKSVQGKFPCAPAEPGKLPARYQIQPASHEILNIAATEIEIASERTSDGYTLEVEIPTDTLKLEQGTVIGFDLKLIDHDSQTSTYGSSTKKLVRAWTWSGIKPERKPHGFGFLVLAE